VTDELDHNVRTAMRRRKWPRIFPIAVILFVICACACGYLWVNRGNQMRTAAFATPQAAASTAAGGEQPVSRANLDAFKRQTFESMRSATENLEAQKADMKKLSDQVTDLVAKVDALRDAKATAPASQPIKTLISGQPVVPPRRKHASKSTGPISVGGAPLPIAPPSDR
jgi:uncharacterized membrane protein